MSNTTLQSKPHFSFRGHRTVRHAELKGRQSCKSQRLERICYAAGSNGEPHTGNHERASPRRGVVILPGLGNSRTDYAPMAELLEEQGLAVTIAAVNRIDWLRNAAGVVDANYWRGTLNPRPTIDWYLNRIDAAVTGLKRETDGAPVTLLAHSAGGWLGRLYLLGFGTAGIDRLVSIGSPHQPPPQDAKVMDQTRGILTHITQACPGRHHAEVEYVTGGQSPLPEVLIVGAQQPLLQQLLLPPRCCSAAAVAGKYIQGATLTQAGATIAQRLVGQGYKQVCGFADVWGDGIIPLESAHLDGAKHVTLDGVYHSPLGAIIAVDGKPGRPWYGSPEILPRWIRHVVCEESELRQYKVDVDDMLPSAQ